MRGRTLLVAAPRATVGVVGCLDDATIFDLVHGALSGTEMARADEHVDSCVDCRELVVVTARGIGGNTPELRPGERVGRYVVLSELGRGGFGVVYRALDPSLDRTVALKLMRAGVDASQRERLLREAKSMARLSHPNVVTVYEVGTAGSATFIAMELIDGVDLRSWFAERPRTALAIRDVFVQAGEGLAAAHGAGLLHRDFKPDNVVVGNDGRVRVADFGLASGVGEAAGALNMDELDEAELVSSLTATGVLLGTPAYMAPEQLRAEPGDHRSDQYSFCVALFECLYGQRPFSGASLRELRENILRGEPHRGDGVVPAWLERVVLAGLDGDPNNRHPDMRSLIAALQRDPSERWRRGFGVLAGVATVAAMAVAFARSPPEVCTAGDALAARTYNGERSAALSQTFAASGVAFASRSFAQVDAIVDRWRGDWGAAHDDACKATRVRGEQSERVLDARVACLERQRGQVHAVLVAIEGARADGLARAVDAVLALPRTGQCADVEALAEVAAPPEGAREDIARVERGAAEARALLAVGKLEEASLRSQELVVEAVKIGHDPLVARVRGIAADARRELGDLSGAETDAAEGLWAARRARDWRAEASAWLRMAAILGTRGEYLRAEMACRHAEAVLTYSPDATLAARLHSALGVIETQLGHFDSAASQLQKALTLRTKAFGPESIEVARVHTNLGNLERSRGAFAQAESHHRRARTIDRRALGDGHPNEARHRHNLARVVLLQGRVTEARELYGSALELKRTIYGAMHAEVGTTYNSLGILNERDTEYVAARSNYEQAVVRLGAERPVEASLARLNLARILIDFGDFEMARQHLEKARTLAARIAHVGLVARVDAAMVYLENDPPTAPTAAAPPFTQPTPWAGAATPLLPAAPPLRGAPPPAAPPLGPPPPAPPAAPPRAAPVPAASARVQPAPLKPRAKVPATPRPSGPPAGAYMPGQAWD